MNPSFFVFFHKSKKVFLFILILNYFSSCWMKVLRWRFHFFQCVKDFAPLSLLLALSLRVICWYLFLFLGTFCVFWLMLRFYFYQWFWKILLFLLIIFFLFLSSFTSSTLLLLLFPKSFYCLAQRVYNFPPNEETFSCYFSS